jgi:hypothetical protein
MLLDITFSQSVSAMPDEADEYQFANQGSRKTKSYTGISTSVEDARPDTPGES